MRIADRLIGGSNRQRDLLRRLREARQPVVIYGAGVYAYVLKRFLDANGVAVGGVMVDAAYHSERTFMGMALARTEDALARLAGQPIVAGIANYPLLIDKLARLGVTDVHVIDVPDYLNMPNAFMDRQFVQENAERFDAAWALLADELSRETYVAAINTKINEDLEHIRPYVRLDRLYFPATEFPLHDSEVLLDVGGFTGDTVREFHQVTGGRYSRIISLEPSEENFDKLQATIEELRLTRVLPLRIGAWDEKTTLPFAAQEWHIDNRISPGGAGRIAVDRIDSLLHGIAESVSLMKFDINGAEYPAISGARETIRRCRPRVVVRLHRKEDFFRLPILLKELAPDMHLYLRQRNYMSMMLVLYGVFDSA